MTRFVLAFALGVLWLQTQPQLPERPLLYVLVGGLGLLCAALYGVLSGGFFRRTWVVRRGLLLLLAMGLGAGWATWRAEQRLAEQLPRELENVPQVVTGVITSLPQKIDRGWRFDFELDSPATLPSNISLAWYAAPMAGEEGAVPVPPLNPGARWQLEVKLKRPHGNVNPDGFDFEGWLFERGIRASGYVRAKADNRLLDPFVMRFDTVVERMRQHIRSRFEQALPDAPYAAVLVALAVGDQQGIEAAQWEAFSRTGITHLISISGLHITMFAGLAYALVSWLWRRSQWLMLHLPAQRAAVLGGALAAWGYCLLAGFAVPAQRTLYMLLVVAAALWMHRHLAARHVLSLALLVVLLFDPWAVLAAGFWLSFGAVALLFYIGSGRVGEAHWLLAWGRAQWAMTLGMVPMLIALFQQFSLVSPIANAIAIPVVSFVVTPLVLVPAFMPVWPVEYLLPLAHWVFASLMWVMDRLAALPLAVWQTHAPPWWAVGLAMLGMAWMLLPRGVQGRWLGLLTLLPLFLLPAPRPDDGDVWVTTLDVGQGLAVHVQTAKHDFLYDTGPAYSDDANSGNRIILPYLRAQGVGRLDGMVVSHADKDHSGGAASVVDGMPVEWLMTSVAFEDHLAALPVEQTQCLAGMSWEWDGVRFEVLHPDASTYEHRPAKTNDMSCVVRVVHPKGKVLLTGDIEALSERAMLDRQADVQAEVLLAPHHGSKTSSTPAFIQAVGARTVIFPAGYLNRFNHPRPDVLARYEASGAELLRTDRHGAVRIKYTTLGMQTELSRTVRRRYWFGE